MFPCALRALGMIRSRGAPLDQAECLRVSEPQDAPLSRPLSSRVSGGRLGPRACVSLSRRPNPPPLRRINLLPTFGGARFVWLVRSSGVTPPVLTRPGVLYQPFNFSFFSPPSSSHPLYHLLPPPYSSSGGFSEHRLARALFFCLFWRGIPARASQEDTPPPLQIPDQWSGVRPGRKGLLSAVNLKVTGVRGWRG